MPVAPSLPVLGTAAVAVLATFAALWWRQTRTGNATTVDAAWAMAIGGLGAWFALVGPGDGGPRWLAGALAVGWSARLSLHLLRDRVLGQRAEDGRYRAMRTHWGAAANARFFWFYLAQGAAALLFALPFGWLAGQRGPLQPMQWLGVCLAVAAQCGVAAADRQLARHRADPAQRGRTCRAGLWRWSRHPNYFFEWLTWCGIALCAAPAAGLWAVLQPAALFVLVRFVTGVPFAERQALKSRGDDYRRYQSETSTFVPWVPRHRAASRP